MRVGVIGESLCLLMPSMLSDIGVMNSIHDMRTWEPSFKSSEIELVMDGESGEDEDDVQKEVDQNRC